VLATLLAAALLCTGALGGRALADPLRLRGDALAEARSPVGLLVLQADGDLQSWISAEALVWMGTFDEDTDGDALVVLLRIRDPKRRGELKLGRQVLTAGTLQPVHLDGAVGLARLPHQLTLEAFGGVPVTSGLASKDPWPGESALGSRELDWLAGARVAKRFTDLGSVGLAYMHRRDHGRLTNEEVALDLAATPAKKIDLAAGAAVDLVELGLSELRASATFRRGAARYVLFALHRSPSHLLPATSLFTVLGDVPSQKAGASIRWRAAPRLDVDGTAAARYYGGPTGDQYFEGDLGAELSLRALLRLDPLGAGALGLELRRNDAPEGSWSGVRGTARLPLAGALTAGAEAEVVIPDDGGDRGSVWPWGLASLGWHHGHWEAAAAVEASASPQYDYEVTGLFRLSRTWEVVK